MILFLKSEVLPFEMESSEFNDIAVRSLQTAY
jgi:hypothetical protein